MAMSAFGVEDDRLSKAAGSAAAYQRVARGVFGTATRGDRARSTGQAVGAGARRMTGNAGRGIRHAGRTVRVNATTAAQVGANDLGRAGAGVRSAAGKAGMRARFEASDAALKTRRATSAAGRSMGTAGRTVGANTRAAGQVGRHELGRAGTAIRSAEYRPLEVSPAGMRLTRAGKIYGAAGATGAAGAGGGYAYSRRNKD